MKNVKFDAKATHASVLVAFAPNGGKMSDAFEWLLVEGEADVFALFAAARAKAVNFMSKEDADSATLFITEITQQWGADGIAL